MFMKRSSNESGIVLVIVITFVLIMSVVLAGFFTRNISQALSAGGQANRINAYQVAQGAYWIAYNQLLSGNNTLIDPPAETIGGVTYNIHFNATGPQSNQQVNVQVTYPD